MHTLTLAALLLAPARSADPPAPAVAAPTAPASPAARTAPATLDPVATDRGVDPLAVEAAPVAAPEPTPAPPPGPVATPLTAVPAANPPPAPPPMPPPDRPIRWRVDLGPELGFLHLRDPAWQAFDRGTRVFQLGATLRADVRLAGGRLFFGGGASLRRFSSGGGLHGIATAITVREPLAFARLSVVAVEGVDVIVQAGAGASIVDLRLSSAVSAAQRSVVPLVDGQAGVALYFPKRWLPRRRAARVSIGVEMTAGYAWRGEVDVRPAVVTDDDPIAADTTSLGGLSLRGLTWRTGLFLRFQ